MPFAESPELLPTVHQIGAMNATESSERMRYFASLFILTYLATVLLGTCIMMLGPRCGCCGANRSREGWQAMVSMVAATCDVEDATSLEDDSNDDSKSSEDAPAAELAAELDTRNKVRKERMEQMRQRHNEIQRRHNEIQRSKVHQRWLVTMVFSAVFCTSLGAAVFSLLTDRLSSQAVAAAARAASVERTFAFTAFFEGTVTGTFPLIADAYDTLKDVLVGALCIHSDHIFLQGLGVASLVYLAAIHLIFLGWFPKVKELVSENPWNTWWIEDFVGVYFLSEGMSDRFVHEMLHSYAPIMVCPTALKQGRLEPEDDACCSCLWKIRLRLSNFFHGMMDAFRGLAYKQVTLVKGSSLAIESIFQGMVGIVPQLHQTTVPRCCAQFFFLALHVFFVLQQALM
eukprot:Skav222439  [mRNA]  locus=scaffold1766:125740:127554:+ [translate_table: standard]